MHSKDKHQRKESTIPQSLSEQLIKIQEAMIQKLQTGDITLGQSTQIGNPQEDCIAKLKNLKNSKQEIQLKLQEFDEEQRKLRMMQRKYNQSKNGRREKSVWTEQERERIIQVKRQKREYERRMKEKLAIMMETIEEREKEREEELNFKKDLLKKERVIKLAKKRQRTEQAKSKNLNSSLSSSNPSSGHNQYIYIRNMEKENEQKKQKQQQTLLLLAEKKKKMKIDFEALKQSSIKYEKYIKQKQIEHTEQMKIEMKSRLKYRLNIPKNKFMKMVEEEEKKRKMADQVRKYEKMEMRVKVVEFKNYVTENFRPKANSSSQFSPKKTSRAIQNLSHDERYRKGNEYLEQAKSMASKNKSQQNCLSSDQQANSLKSMKIYPDYLTEFKNKRPKQEEPLLEKLLKGKRLSTHKAEQAIKVIQLKDELQKIGKKNNLIQYQFESAKQKLAILNSLLQDEDFSTIQGSSP